MCVFVLLCNKNMGTSSHSVRGICGEERCVKPVCVCVCYYVFCLCSTGTFQGYPPRSDYRPEGGFQSYSNGFSSTGVNKRGSGGAPYRGGSRGSGRCPFCYLFSGLTATSASSASGQLPCYSQCSILQIFPDLAACLGGPECVSSSNGGGGGVMVGLPTPCCEQGHVWDDCLPALSD